jgi:hypothetical protein
MNNVFNNNDDVSIYSSINSSDSNIYQENHQHQHQHHHQQDSNQTITSHDEQEEYKKRTQELLDQHKLNVDDVLLVKKVGAGSFGEVFQGLCLGEPVAIKTLIKVNEANLKVFKAEILLLSTLRHPNIVNFVGACWAKELVCLVVEEIHAYLYKYS